MDCVCFPCDLKNLDEIIEVSFMFNDGSIVQETQMFSREVEELLARWIAE